MKMMSLIYLCIIFMLGYCNGQSVNSVATGMHSTKRESNGLYLGANSDFQPIGDLTVKLTLSKSAAFFVHYHVTIDSGITGHDFWTKLRINYMNAGALVHSGNQQYKTATGYWMGNLDPGYYTFEVYYKSPVSISMSSSSDYQAAVINLMWLENTKALSDGVNCEFPLNNFYYNNNPVKGLEIELTIPPTSYSNYVLAAYQFSTHHVYSSHWSLARMHMNNEQISSTTMAKGSSLYIDLSSSWMEQLQPGEYQFGVTYRNYGSNSYYEDCRSNHTNNQNLYVMVLPSTASCNIRNIEPSSSIYVSTTNSWKDTDLTYNMYLSRSSHVIIRYQFSTAGSSSYHVTRLMIGSSIQKHSASITGSYSNYAGNSGLWQGVLSSGYHLIILQYKTGRAPHYHYPYYYSRSTSYFYYTRSMDVVYCY